MRLLNPLVRNALARFFRRAFGVVAGGTLLVLLFPFVFLVRWFRQIPSPEVVPEIKNLSLYKEPRPSMGVPILPILTAPPPSWEPTEAQRAAGERELAQVCDRSHDGPCVPFNSFDGRVLCNVTGIRMPGNQESPSRSPFVLPAFHHRPLDHLPLGAHVCSKDWCSKPGLVQFGVQGSLCRQHWLEHQEAEKARIAAIAGFPAAPRCRTPEGAHKGTPEGLTGTLCARPATVLCAKCAEARCNVHTYEGMKGGRFCAGDAASGCLGRALKRGLPTGPIEWHNGKPREVWPAGFYSEVRQALKGMSDAAETF
jgi:hypothetical protein